MQRSGVPAHTAASDAVKNQAALVEALRRPALYDGVSQVTVLETHISYVLLTGRYAYKIKKAVDLGFLDYTTLDARHFYCEEELRLNRRLAPDIYLDVLTLTGNPTSPAFGGHGQAIEYAVKMREFPQDALLSQMLDHDTLMPSHLDALATRIAAFHGAINVDKPTGPFGHPNEVRRLALDNFAELRELVEDTPDQAQLETLREWTEREYAVRAGELERRRQDGFVRECHGDLHLNNVALVDGRITIFDCVEFSEHMRWGDVMSEVAFVAMDLDDRKRSDLSFSFLNAYLERTGDYSGLGVLRFFLPFRAMVRAKVTWFRQAQPGPQDQKQAMLEEYRGYVNLARRYARTPQPAIILMHGVAGSGKTTASQWLLESVPGIRIRTDIERKRLHAFNPQSHARAPIEGGMYSQVETDRTYRQVCALARRAVASGYVTIIDAAFLMRRQRNQFRDLASELGVPFLIVSLSANQGILRDRLNRRSSGGTDASDADTSVIEHQRRTQEPLAPDEQPSVVTFDAEAMVDSAASAALCRTVRARLTPSSQVADLNRGPAP